VKCKGSLGSNPITQILFIQLLKGNLNEIAYCVLGDVWRICGGKILSETVQNNKESHQLNESFPEIPYNLKTRLAVHTAIKQAKEIHLNSNSHENPPWKDLTCSQCMRPFFLFGGFDNIRHPLCQKCWVLHQNTLREMEERNIRGINFALTEMEDASGMPRGFFGRYQTAPSKPTTIVGELTLNNITIEKSAIGIINTGSIGGSIENIDVTLDIMNNDPSMQSFKNALKNLTEAILKSTEASNEQKEAILELISAIADEVRTSKDKQRFTVIKTLLKSAQELVGGISTLHTIWTTLQSAIYNMFP
jgi:hypothetical protein